MITRFQAEAALYVQAQVLKSCNPEIPSKKIHDSRS